MFIVWGGCQLQKTPSEIISEITVIYSDDCTSLRTIQRWCRDIRDGCCILSKTPPHDITPWRHPRWRLDPSGVVENELERNPCLSCQGIADNLFICKATVWMIIKHRLDFRNILWVLNILIDAMKIARMKCCKEQLRRLFLKRGFVWMGSHLVVNDESWFYWSSERHVRKESRKLTTLTVR